MWQNLNTLCTISVWNCSSRFSTSSWSIMRSARRDACFPYPRVLRLYSESGCADISVERMWTFSRGLYRTNLQENLRWQYHPLCAQTERLIRRGVKLFMIISDSIVNKPIFHSVTYSPAKRFACLLYTSTFKIRVTSKDENLFRNLKQIASNVFYFLGCRIIEQLMWKVQMPLINSLSFYMSNIQL